MTDPLDTLRPEVRDTLDWIEAEYPEASTIRAELLRLAAENAQLRDVLADRDMDREMAAHANRELAALKARIADAPVATLVFTGSGGDLMLLWAENPDEWVGKDVRLLVDEPQGDNAKEGRSRE